jgi:hypothetical protein
LPAGYLPAGWAVGFLSTHRLGRHAGHTKKPRAVWNAQPVKAISLPDAFWNFARRLPSDYEVVKLLKLLPEYGISAFVEGTEAAASVGAYAYEAVRSKLEQRQHTSPPAQLLTNPVQIQAG